jgi:hypothetical protein
MRAASMAPRECQGAHADSWPPVGAEEEEEEKPNSGHVGAMRCASQLSGCQRAGSGKLGALRGQGADCLKGLNCCRKKPPCPRVMRKVL